MIEFNPMGGNILSPTRENSYPHRQSLYNVGMFVYIYEKKHSQRDIQSLTNYHRSIDPIFSGRHYVNYPDFELFDDEWATRYYGDSLNDLLDIKRKYDPTDLFDFGRHSLSSLV